MLEVRDYTKKLSEYKGRWTYALELDCPCRPCYNPHDCGYRNHKQWIMEMRCLTNYKRGCPTNMPKPQHIVKTKRQRKCLRCKQK